MLQTAANSSIYITKALKTLLRPMVNLLIAKGITYPELNELLKELFVEVAETDFKLTGKQQTDSRINFLTGIHRKDVKRIRNQSVDEELAPNTMSLGALLISRWLGDPFYTDAQGLPLALPRLFKQGGELSFEGLVISVNKDIRSRAILDEWQNMHLVTIDEQDRICLNHNAFIPEQGYEEKVWFFGENLRDHIAAAAFNLDENTPPHLERAVYYDQLSADSVAELAELSKTLGMEMLIKINSQALALQTDDKKTQLQTKHRMRVGLYFYKTLDVDSDSEQRTLE